jgi:hypothetical protein
LPTDPVPAGSPPAISLADWAGREVALLAGATGAAALHQLDGRMLVAERAALNGFTVPGRVAAGGGCRLIRAHDGWIALNLARADDRDLLPALFADAALDPAQDSMIASRVARWAAAPLVARGRAMGLAIAHMDERPVSPAITLAAAGPKRPSPHRRSPLVIDLSALWAGPLAAHLLWLAGARVVKVESPARPDSMRAGDPGLFALLQQGKDNVTLDPRLPADRHALVALIQTADIVIEAARPRALAQLGIDAAAIVRAKPGLLWITITGHGIADAAADWVGFGDDCAVASGLSAALHAATGHVAFVGDALADPLTGIAAARAAWSRWTSGDGGHVILSMSATVADAMSFETARDPAAFTAILRQWTASVGEPLARGPVRSVTAPVAPPGRDNGRWLAC